MYTKLILKNARRSINDYLIYIITLTICVMLFYAFLSITSKYYQPNIGSEYTITILSNGLKMAIFGVTLLLLFLINYVNKYMLIRKQREFAILSVVGMEKRTVAWMFFGETFIMGIVSVIAGILLGNVCSQAITMMLLSAYDQKFQFILTVYPDTVIVTIVFFLASFLFIGFFNVRTIRKIKIIDMLHVEQYNEPQISKARYMRNIYVMYVVFLLYMVIVGIVNMHRYGNTRFPFGVQVTFAGNIVAPFAALLWGGFWLRRRKRWDFNRLIAISAILAIVNIITILNAAIVRGRYFLVTEVEDGGKFFIYLLIHLIFFVCGIINIVANMIVIWKEKNPEHKYKNCNLFLFGQIISKLNTSSKAMTLLCLTLSVSIMLFIADPALSGWISGHLDVRSLYDVQINTKYNNVYDELLLPNDDYEIISNYLEEKNIKTSYDRVIKLYLPRREEFKERRKLTFPIVAISLSDYNSLREIQGFEQIELEEDEYATQWQSLATQKDKEDFLKTHAEVLTDAGTLTLAEHSMFDQAIGETLYNSYTDVIYIFPDDVCEKLLAVKSNRYILTSEPIAYNDAIMLEKQFKAYYVPEEYGDEGTAYQIRTSTVQKNGAKASSFILRVTLIYSAVVLMVICFTILSLQQLMDVPYYRYRFGVLNKIGVDESQIMTLVLQQLAFWFGLPVMIAFGVSVIGSIAFFKVISEEIAAYIGFDILLHQVFGMICVFLFLLTGYFICTWHLLKNSVKQKELST